MSDFAYTNHTGRRTGPFVTAAGLLLPGVRRVQSTVSPFAASWRAANIQALEAEGPLWVALGDSMTLGIGASRWDQGWVGQLAARLGRFRVVNLAASGARVQDVLEQQLPVLDALGVRPDLVTVLIGSNDFMPRVDRRDLPRRFAALIAALPDQSVVATLPNPQAGALNRQIERAVADRRLRAAEFRGPRMSWRGKLADDHFHPNDRGYAGMADVFADALDERKAA